MEVEVDTWTLDSGWEERGVPTPAPGLWVLHLLLGHVHGPPGFLGTTSMQFAVLQQ